MPKHSKKCHQLKVLKSCNDDGDDDGDDRVTTMLFGEGVDGDGLHVFLMLKFDRASSASSNNDSKKSFGKIIKSCYFLRQKL